MTGIKNNRWKYRGFSIMEIMLALALFTCIVLIFGAVLPVALRGANQSDTYIQATLLAQHKIDQLRQAGYNSLDVNTLRSLGVIDGTNNVDGSFAFTYVDNLVDNNGKKGYFGSASGTPQATGSIVIGQALPQLAANAPSTLRGWQATVTIRWNDASGRHPGSYITHTIIAAP